MTMTPGDKARDAAGERRAISRGERTITYFAQGRGPCVLLVASAGREASDFNELATAVAAAGYRTLAVDPPGVGGSDLPQAPLTLFDLADDMAGVLLAEGAEAPVFAVGHAFGNRVVRALASRHRIAGLVLVAAGGQRPIPRHASAALTACFNGDLPRADHAAAVTYGFFAASSVIPPHWLRGWHADTAAVQGAAARSQMAQEWGGGGQTPMLVLQADADTIAPRKDAGDVLKAAFPDRVSLVIVPGAGHALLPEQPDLIASETIGFLRRLS